MASQSVKSKIKKALSSSQGKYYSLQGYVARKIPKYAYRMGSHTLESADYESWSYNSSEKATKSKAHERFMLNGGALGRLF